MGLDWLVLKCESCELAFGKSRHAKDLHCPHCNHSQSKVISRHLNANQASRAVSASNVPPEIQEQLSDWLTDQHESFQSPENESVDGNSILYSASDKDGIVTLESLQKTLLQMNLPLDAELFAEQACAEGELLRDGTNRWKRP
jgi:hypothetical protein